MTDPIAVRSATADDQPGITQLIRDAHLNPRDLDWRRFVVADAGGRLVGCAQVRVHRLGTREVASVAVSAKHQGSGIGRRLVEAILAHERDTIYLMTERHTEGYFERFGFKRMPAAAAPPDFRRQYRIGVIATTVLSLVARRRLRIVPMRRAAPPPTPPPT